MNANTKPKTFVIGAMLMAVMMISVGSLYLENNKVSAQEDPSNIHERVISVTGTATTSVEPDLLVITFGVETQEITAKQALDTNSQTMNDIIKAIKSTTIVETLIIAFKCNY